MWVALLGWGGLKFYFSSHPDSYPLDISFLLSFYFLKANKTLSIMIQSRGGSAFSVKGQTVHILGFTATQNLCFLIFVLFYGPFKNKKQNRTIPGFLAGFGGPSLGRGMSLSGEKNSMFLFAPRRYGYSVFYYLALCRVCRRITFLYAWCRSLWTIPSFQDFVFELYKLDLYGLISCCWIC